MNGGCAQCRRQVDVARWRIADLGLRWLCARCSTWMVEAGMALTPVTDADPRRPSRGLRLAWSTAFRAAFLRRAA